jgi:site-specific recombinase XerD
VSLSASVGPLIQDFFVQHLTRQRCASPQTVAAYRDAFRLLLSFLHQKTGTVPSALRLTNLDAPAVLSFLDHLEQHRKNAARSRNVRLAAIRSFFRYVAMREPDSLGLATSVLAIPSKRVDRRLVGYLTREEMDALLAAPDRSEWIGRRDYTLLLTLYNSGARVSEIATVQRSQVSFDTTPSIRLHGKGRKERAVPLWPRTGRALQTWFREVAEDQHGFAFPNARGGPLTRHGVAYIIDQAVQRAQAPCPSLAAKRVSPHVIRHTTAMHLLQGGVELAVIALWLGHESVETTHGYVEADLAMKERALEKLAPLGAPARRFKADDALMAFLATV